MKGPVSQTEVSVGTNSQCFLGKKGSKENVQNAFASATSALVTLERPGPKGTHRLTPPEKYSSVF